MPHVISQFPRQKVSTASKTEDWALKCVKAASQPILQNNTHLRKSIDNKIANYRLRVNDIDLSDVEDICNSNKLQDDSFPKTFRHIGRGNTYLNLLIGEKLKRRLDFKVYLSSKDQDGISLKEQEQKEYLLEAVKKSVLAGVDTPEQAQAELQRLDHYMKYDYQDLREKVANQMLRREIHRQNMKSKFAETFEDALVCAEEILYIVVTGRELHVNKVNPINFYTTGSGYSSKVEDSDIIVWYDYMSPGQIIDKYYDSLTSTQIDKLEEQGFTPSSGNPMEAIDNQLMASSTFPGGVRILTPNELRAYGAYRDVDGNILVTHVNWRSRKQIGELTYPDPMDGSMQKTIVPEGYKPKKELGESVEWFWVNEWWQGTLIKNEILVNWGPIPYQSESPYQLSAGCPNFVGQFFNTNQGQSQSLLDIIKPLDYSYDIAYWKREQEIVSNFGTLTFYNSSMVPHGWDPRKWLAYGMKTKLLPMNPTQEILKGHAKGKSVGVFNTLTATAIQSNAFQDIKMYTEVMLSLEDQMSKITGITPQREAQTSASETATGNQLAYQQSSAITEPWFYKHSEFEQRALSLLLEKAKYLYKTYPQAGQYVFDQIGLEMIQSFDSIAERYFDVHVMNSGNEQDLQKVMKDLAHAAMQAGQASIGDIASIYLGESLQDTIRKLNLSSERIQKQEQQMAAERNKIDQENAIREDEYKRWKDQLTFELENRKISIMEAELAHKSADTNQNWIKDEVEMDMTVRELAQREKESKREDKFKRDELAAKERIEKFKARNKPKPASAK